MAFFVSAINQGIVTELVPQNIITPLPTLTQLLLWGAVHFLLAPPWRHGIAAIVEQDNIYQITHFLLPLILKSIAAYHIKIR